MGMFDDLRCDYPLPAAGANALRYQTKDTPAQWCDLYVIDADGQLLHEQYDTEDRSDPNAEGLMRFAGCMTRVSKRLVPVTDFTGEIRFYGGDCDWVEFSSYFVGGKLQSVTLIEDTRDPQDTQVAGARATQGHRYLHAGETVLAMESGEAVTVKPIQELVPGFQWLGAARTVAASELLAQPMSYFKGEVPRG